MIYSKRSWGPKNETRPIFLACQIKPLKEAGTGFVHAYHVLELLPPDACLGQLVSDNGRCKLTRVLLVPSR
jgi:hypothetical protein